MVLLRYIAFIHFCLFSKCVKLMSNISFQSKLFQPSVWDEIPVKRDNKNINLVIEPDFEMDLEDYSKPIKLPKNFRSPDHQLEQTT